ncbi:MAG: acyl--CoA ligase [Ideonella sp.]|nr:acyl--CoA ligase [Ideonella sp.]
MARGLTRDQIGITEEMIRTFGDAVFCMSHNIQVREGDPVRNLDFAEIERQREAMGLADVQIAERIGLTREQVMFIRNTEESRRLQIGQQAYLLDLGGGRRFRAEKVTRLEDRFRFSENALRLRAAMAFDPQQVGEYLRRGWWRDDTLSGWIARHAKERPEAPALIQGSVTISWRELADRSACLAEGLRLAGVARGEVVAVQLPNVTEFVLAYLAICRLGAVMSAIHMAYRDAELAPLLIHNRAVAAICLVRDNDWSPAEAYCSMRASIPTLKTVIALGERADGTLSLGDLIEKSSPLAAQAVPAPVASDPFLLLYTSGTISAPKAVPHSYHTMLSNARLGALEHRGTSPHRILSAAPFSHLFGLYSLHVAWSAGAAVVLLPVFSPPELALSIERDKPSGLWAGPAHIAACRALGLFEKYDFGSLKLAILSGSACPPELVRWFQAKIPDCAVIQLWGMTETQGALYTRPGDAPDVAASTAGRPSPGTEVRILKPDGSPCAANQEGELQVRGCLLFPGFFDNDAANQTAFTADRWYRTGDLATADAEGNVAITGRDKDIINRGGVKFNPRDVEDLLDAHPKVLQSAIVPMPDPVLGERACCFVTLRPGASALALEEVTEFLLLHNIAKTKLPERLVVVPEMPLTPTRKIIKRQLKIPA